MDADVVVIGGGPVGAATAMYLRRHGLSAVVLDRARFPRDKACGEGLMPSGAAALRELGVDLAREGYPAVFGVRYRIADGTEAAGRFRTGCGFGVRRRRFDAMLADRAGVLTGVRATGLEASGNGVAVSTSVGTLRASAAVGADGMRSQVRSWMGWSRPARTSGRYALVGHFDTGEAEAGEPAPGEGGTIVVTVLERCEVYECPAGPGEMLAAVLGPRGALRMSGRSVESSYRCLVGQAHPQLAARPLAGEARIRGAGPFRVDAADVAGGRVFLVGDAAGFVDPLTGEAIAAGLGQARALAGFLAEDFDLAAVRYRRWFAAQWRRRRQVCALALALTGSGWVARRAMAGIRRHPDVLAKLLEVNDGARGLGSVGVRGWAALAGL